jgi:CheY-like chemotaxis protein
VSKSILFVDDEIEPGDGTGGLQTAEDTDVNLYMAYYVQAMKDADYSVTVASNVDDAIESFQQSHFDLVIVDIMMPWGNAFTPTHTANGLRTGIKLAELVARKCPRTRIVFLSNYPNFRSIKSELGLQLDIPFLLKLDFTPLDLVNYVRGFLGEQQIED